MEDAVTMVGDFAGSGSSYFAVFDGHNGPEASKYAAYNVHRTFNMHYGSDADIPSTLSESLSEVNDFIKKHWPEQGTTAAVAIVIKDYIYTAQEGDTEILLLTHTGDVKELSENDRIEGYGTLGRTLGDAKRQGVVAEPHQTRTHRKDGMALVIASKGLWTNVEKSTVARIVAGKTTPHAAANTLRDLALKKGCRDNISVVVVFLTAK
jgi:serine/threonine protein phosphatase PrpC